MTPKPHPAGPGQESVWSYPRPPRVEPCEHHLQIFFAGEVIADTRRSYRVLETSHPPVYYIHEADVALNHLEASDRQSHCEFKGAAVYYDIVVGPRCAPRAAWTYPDPSARFSDLRGHFAFYAGQVDTCTVNGEIVTPQEGDFYGGWITSDVVGPFKGAPGTRNW